MKHSLIVNTFVIILLLSFCISCEAPKQSVSPKANTSSQQDFIASISQVWADTINSKRKVVLANIEGSNMFIGTDERYGEEGIINLQGITKNFELNWTVMIKIKQTDFPKRYIAYKGILTDTASNHKRMIATSPLDTLYLKALPPPSKK
jgi:hypothetical protein